MPSKKIPIDRVFSFRLSNFNVKPPQGRDVNTDDEGFFREKTTGRAAGIIMTKPSHIIRFASFHWSSIFGFCILLRLYLSQFIGDLDLSRVSNKLNEMCLVNFFFFNAVI